MIHGQHEGETGMVVRVETPVAYVFTDSSHQVGGRAGGWVGGRFIVLVLPWLSCSCDLPPYLAAHAVGVCCVACFQQALQ